MATYPRKPRAAFLEWCRVHEAVFSDHAAEIGVGEIEAAAFAAAVDRGKTLLLEQKAAQEAARVATQKVKTAFDGLEKDAGNMVRTIRAFAEMSETPSAVYAVAQIPPPARPSPLPPPAQPIGLTVTLEPTTGGLTLRWKATNPAGSGGTAYLIRRRLPGEAAFAFIGVSGKKAFVDETLPAGPKSVQYTVQGQRADLAGPASPIFHVHFGKLPHGGQTATVSAVAPGRTAETTGWNVELPVSGGGVRMP